MREYSDNLEVGKEKIDRREAEGRAGSSEIGTVVLGEWLSAHQSGSHYRSRAEGEGRIEEIKAQRSSQTFHDHAVKHCQSIPSYQ